MDNAPFLFSLLFFIVFSIYSFWGFYVILGNSKLSMNKVFFAMCSSLALWCLGFSFAISAPDIETCIFWRRFSALGWGSLYSILLHFFLIMTNSRLLKHQWAAALLYLPAVVTIYVFALFPDTSLTLYNLESTPLGWINISEKSVWNSFFNAYYSSFTIASMLIMWKWGRRASNEIQRKQSGIILIALLAAFIICSITDTVFTSYFKATIPQIAPLIILMPISVLFIFIKNNGLMNVHSVKNLQLMMTKSTRAHIYNFITFGLVAGGFINIATMSPITGNNIKSILMLTLFLFFIAFLIQCVQHLSFSDEFKDNFILTVISLCIPFITLQFIEYASITVWAFPFVLIIIFTMFNNKKMLVVLSISTVATQVAVWLLAPEVLVQVEAADHIARIMLYLLAIWLAFYVNKVYMLRLKENAQQVLIQKNIAEISTEFATVDHSNVDEKIDLMLKKTGRFFCVDRAYLFIFDLEKNTARCSHSWCAEKSRFETDSLQNLPLFMFPWFMEQFSKNGLVNISDVDLMPEESEIEKGLFLNRNIKSIISIPFSRNQKVQGFLGFVSATSVLKWNEDHINTLKIMSNLASNAISKVKSEERQEYMAYYDQLTSLANRTLFKDRLGHAINSASQNGNIIGVMFLDLDSFKNINDTMGHENGDILLQMVARKLSQLVRKSDTVARFGGDEFLILINNILTRKDIDKVASHILSMFNLPFNISGQDFFITGSAGISLYPMDGLDVDTLIKNADIAMYNAKENGKNQYQMCTTNMKNEIQNAMELTNNLYNVQERNELILYYQPQVDIKSEKIVGFEALLRWDHPKLGRISPGVFIPLAEKTGLIDPIGEWVMRTACFQNKSWQDKGFAPVRMGVNLSFIQFKNSNLIEKVSNILSETGMSSEYLDLEITESTAIWETNYILDSLKKLKELGVYISIDDFGTEYSSLSRLKLLPFDRIKMDMQFVHGIDESEKDQAYANLIINLANNLGLTLVAEGVETITQLEFLRQRACHEIQGNYYYKPMTADEIEALFLNNPSLFSKELLL